MSVVGDVQRNVRQSCGSTGVMYGYGLPVSGGEIQRDVDRLSSQCATGEDSGRGTGTRHGSRESADAGRRDRGTGPDVGLRTRCCVLLFSQYRVRSRRLERSEVTSGDETIRYLLSGIADAVVTVASSTVRSRSSRSTSHFDLHGVV